MNKFTTALFAFLLALVLPLQAKEYKYQTVPGDLPQTTGKAHLQSQMNALCQLFLTELGAEFSQYDPSAIAKNAYSRTDNVLIASMSWSDILYGEVTINFSVTANQFSVRIL